MKTFNITQLHRYEYTYEIDANSEEEALALLNSGSINEPVLKEFHSTNDKEDWIIEEKD